MTTLTVRGDVWGEERAVSGIAFMLRYQVRILVWSEA